MCPQQVIGEYVPEDGEDKEGGVGEQHHPPDTLVLQVLLVAAQDGQPHADAHDGACQMGHEAGLGARGHQGWRETEPYGTAHLGAHCKGEDEE